MPSASTFISLLFLSSPLFLSFLLALHFYFSSDHEAQPAMQTRLAHSSTIPSHAGSSIDLKGLLSTPPVRDKVSLKWSGHAFASKHSFCHEPEPRGV